MFAIRTVKNGQVKIRGKIFKPYDPHKPYNGELEGLRFAFGLYDSFDQEGNKVKYGADFVSLWGSEANYYAVTSGDWLKEANSIDGYLYWVWWRTDEETKRVIEINEQVKASMERKVA